MPDTTRKNFTRYLKKSLLTKNAKIQIKAVKMLLNAFPLEKSDSAENLAAYLANEDLIEIMADQISYLEPNTIKIICHCFSIVATSERFFATNQAVYLINNLLRTLQLFLKNKKQSETVRILLKLTTLILKRLLEKNIQLSSVCDAPYLLELCKSSLKFSDQDLILSNGCFILMALIREKSNYSSVDEAELLQICLAFGKQLQLNMNDENARKRSNSVILFCDMGVTFFRYLASIPKNRQHTKILNFFFTNLKSSLIPYLLQKMNPSEERVHKAIFALVLELLTQTMFEIDKQKICNHLISSNFLISLTVFRFNYRSNVSTKPLLDSLIAEVIVLKSEELCQISMYWPGGSDSFRKTIRKGVSVLPESFQDWPKILNKSSCEAQCAILFFWFFYYYKINSVSEETFNAVTEFIGAIRTKIPIPLLKILWFLYALMFMVCAKWNVIKKYDKISKKVIALLNSEEENINHLFTHFHSAELYWAFSSTSIPDQFRQKVVDLWLSKKDRDSANILKSLCMDRDKVSECVLNVLGSTNNPVSARQAAEIFFHVIASKPAKFKVILWSRSFSLLFSQDQNSCSDFRVCYLFSLLNLFPPADLSMKMSFFHRSRSLWEEVSRSASPSHFRIVSKIVQFLRTLSNSNVLIPSHQLTDPKLLKLIEKYLHCSDPSVSVHTSRLFTDLLLHLPKTPQVDGQVTVDEKFVLVRITGNNLDLSTVSVVLMDALLKIAPDSKFITFTAQLSFEFISALFLHLRMLVVKSVGRAKEKIWFCLGTILNYCRKAESARHLAILLVKPWTPYLLLHIFRTSNCLETLFTEGFLCFLANWIHCIVNVRVIWSTLILQSRAQLEFSSLSPVKVIMQASDKVLKFTDSGELNSLSSSRLEQLRSLFNALLKLDDLLPYAIWQSLNLKMILFKTNISSEQAITCLENT